MGRSPGFGSTPANFRPFQTRFRFGSVVLTLLANVTRRSVLQKVRHYSLMELWLIVSMRFQVLFTPLPGFFSPFPHGTSSLSVAKEYLALRGGPRVFPRNSTCFVVLWIHSCSSGFRLQGSNLLWLAFPCHSTNLSYSWWVSEPQSEDWFGLFPVRSPLLGESSFLSFPLGT